jgi:hypothetical protein
MDVGERKAALEVLSTFRPMRGWCYSSNALGGFMLLSIRNGNREEKRPRRV